MTSPHRLASLTVARSDFGRMLSFYRAVASSGDFHLELALGAGHHVGRLGTSGHEVERSGLPIGLRLPRCEGGPAEQAAVVLSGIAAWLEATSPQALVLLGDRFEMLAAAQAATLTRTPIIHVGGGHLTLGAIDERIRHALSKLAAVHWVASAACGQRVEHLGEAASTIVVTGAPELDELIAVPPLPREEFCAQVGLDPSRPFLLCTFHPETNADLSANEAFAAQAEAVLLASPLQVLMTAPCADPGNAPFLALCEQLPRQREGIRYIPSLGLRRYTSALRHAEAMLGNSSSGIIEAATAELPVVNVGRRQDLRDRAANVIDCPFDAAAMTAALVRATSDDFRARCRGIANPYGDGTFAARALAALRSLRWPLPVHKSWTGL